jgi:hypothetical protein
MYMVCVGVKDEIPELSAAPLQDRDDDDSVTPGPASGGRRRRRPRPVREQSYSGSDISFLREIQNKPYKSNLQDLIPSDKSEMSEDDASPSVLETPPPNDKEEMSEDGKEVCPKATIKHQDCYIVI